MIKILIGGSPCTYWSIAQTANRETTASGLGWELFKNFLIAKEKFCPDFFLYENNKSSAQAIKDQISHELGVELMYINSALVSAQNRQRFYAFNWHVEQPIDRGILLKDILDGNAQRIPAYGAADKSRPVIAGYEKQGASASQIIKNAFSDNPSKQRHDYIAEPIKVAEVGNGGQGNRIYSADGKAVAQTAGSGGIGSNTGLYAIPVNTTADGKAQCLRATCYKDGMRNMICNNVDRRTCVAIPSEYAKNSPIYEVKDGFIFIKDTPYPIELADGFYAIRKLSVTECARLQTMPDDYCKAVSKSQAYKGLGNGWTAEVIIHILNGALGKVDRHEKIVVLSMYDGIGTGRYCFDKMGFTNVEYSAYEIDAHAMHVANDNYPDIVQCGDAFALRNNDWDIECLRTNRKEVLV